MTRRRAKHRGTHEAYFYYRDRVGKKNKVDIVTFGKVIYMFNKWVSDRLISGHDVRLPAGLGELTIEGKKVELKYDKSGRLINRLPVDWNSTNKLWDSNTKARENKKLVYYLNPHSNYIRYSFKWKRKNIFLFTKYLYDFKATRANKKRLSEEIKNGQQYKINYAVRRSK